MLQDSSWKGRVCVCVCVSHFSCVPLCDPMDHSPPGSSLFMGFSRQEVLEWVAMPSSRGSSQPGIELVSLMSPALAGRCPQSSPSTVITPLLHLPLAPPGKAEKDLIPPLIMCSGSENWPLSKNWRRDGDFSQWQPIPAFCSFAPDLFGYTGQAAPPRAAYDLIPRHTGLSPPEAPAGQSPQIVLCLCLTMTTTPSLPLMIRCLQLAFRTSGWAWSPSLMEHLLQSTLACGRQPLLCFSGMSVSPLPN